MDCRADGSASQLSMCRSVSIVVEDITPFLPGDTIAYLRLAEGDRRFPVRPISPGLFLIGQGPGCDLRLGSLDIPNIHSVIQTDGAITQILRIAEHPELLVNGEPRVRAVLQDGDLIEIGEIRLAYFSCQAPTEIALESPAESASLSPDQLVDSLESAMTVLADHVSSQERIGNLLKAAQQAVDACQYAETIRLADYAARPTDGREVTSRESHLLTLSRLSGMERRLDEICQVLENIVNQQQMIATALQCVVQRIDDMRSDPQPGSLRASA